MKIYDISQELFQGKVYPGDLIPNYERALSMEKGDVCNLTNLRMCAHNATHIDAPYHFISNGKTIEQLDLSRCVGNCSVREFTGSPDDFETILKNCHKRLLLKGNGVVTLEIARLLNRYRIQLVGVEGQSVGPVYAPMEVHLELLSREVVLLEGLSLCQVPEGDYFLVAAPLKLGGFDGAPCRAILIDFNYGNTK